MACVALVSLMGTIQLEFLQPNHRVSLDDDEKPLQSLFHKLSFLLAFLQKQESKKGGAPIIRDVEIEIRDFALKAEDDIEIQLSTFLLAKDGGYRDKARGKLHQTLREVAEDAQVLLNIINNTGSEPEAASQWLKPTSHPDNVVLGGQSSPNVEDQFNEDAFCAVNKMLFHPSSSRENIVSIVGIPGVGKTTLARRIYDSKEARCYTRAWVTMPREYNLQHILLDLLQSIRPSINNINKESTLDQLKELLHKHLGGKENKYFIVLDNILNTRAWFDIKTCLPHSSQILVLLTSMFYNIVDHDVPRKRVVYEMCALDSHTSWKLFCKRLSLKERITPEFEEIAKCVVEECGGLPLSIVTVAERLSKCDYTLREWKKIEKEVDTLGPLYNDTEHLSKLTLLYNQLPQQLKVCFLYFAIYPKRFKINVKKLIRIWIAEGFVTPLWLTNLEEGAYWHLNYLVRNGLISISKLEHKMSNVCWIHSSLRDFCTREAKKEGIFCAVNTHHYLGLSLDMFAHSCRWLSLYSHKFDYYTLFSSNNPRSLFFFHGEPETYVSFKLLRIVDLSALGVLKRAPPLHLGDLVFLRYLSVPWWFEDLDYVVSNNQNLQTLIVCGAERHLRTPTGHLGSRIWELPHLRYLELGNCYTADPPSMVKEQLQTLSWVSPTHLTKEVYYNSPNINYLKVFYKDAFEPSLDYIEYLPKLEKLTIIVSSEQYNPSRGAVFPAQLKKLRLSGTNLPKKVLEGIGQLRMLKVLKLENAIHDSVWESFGETANLKVLLIEATNLQRWEANPYDFVGLQRLILRRCYCLEGIPREFEFSCCLETIELEQCPSSVVTSAKYIQRNRRDRWIEYAPEYTPLTVVVDGMIHDRF